MTKKCPVSKVAPTVFNITLVQGLNRQIRRMCEHFGYEVVKLERTRIMNVNLKGLAIGDWRDLTQKEMSVLLKSIEGSASEDSNASKRSANTRRKKSNNNRSSQSKGTKENSKRSKNGAKTPAASKGGRPFGRGKATGGKSSGGNGKRPTKGRGGKGGRGSKRFSK
jgi:23S rRNA pseudouridine2604 synthase